jgi:2-dehydropantoate 2-reductase
LNNALNTLSGSTLRNGFLQRDYRLAFATLIGEGLSVAKAKGIKMGKFNGRSPTLLKMILKLPDHIYQILMDRLVKIDAKARSSMLDDLEAGRTSEIEYLQGEIVRQGTALNVDISANSNVLKAVKKAFRFGTSPSLSGSDILKLIKEAS